MKRFRFIAVTASLAVFAAAWPGAARAQEGADPASVSADEVLADAEGLFREANEMATSDPARARELYEAAALKFEHLVAEKGYTNGELYANLANTYFFAGDLGRAILNYRRALSHLPRDRNIRESLAYVRTQCVDVFSFSQGGEFRRAIFFWHYWLGQGTRIFLFGAAYIGLWVIAAWRLFEPRRRVAVPRRVCAVICLLTGVSALMHAVSEHRSGAGVVVAPEVVARKGDSYIYEPAMTNALHSGAEFNLIERRADWVHARFSNGEDAWLPMSSIAFVDARDADEEVEEGESMPGS